jgi:hypothetical protein
MSGTRVEASIARDRAGNLIKRVVPIEAARPDAAERVQWAAASFIADNSLPAELIYAAFLPEDATWRRIEGEPGQQSDAYALGRVLHAGPFVLPFVDSRTLRDMHNCCPACDSLADAIERYCFDWPRPHWHHRHPRCWNRGLWRSHGPPLAFITSNARGFLCLPPE